VTDHLGYFIQGPTQQDPDCTVIYLLNPTLDDPGCDGSPEVLFIRNPTQVDPDSDRAPEVSVEFCPVVGRRLPP
jgi:hypothetical protein